MKRIVFALVLSVLVFALLAGCAEKAGNADKSPQKYVPPPLSCNAAGSGCSKVNCTCSEDRRNIVVEQTVDCRVMTTTMGCGDPVCTDDGAGNARCG